MAFPWDRFQKPSDPPTFAGIAQGVRAVHYYTVMVLFTVFSMLMLAVMTKKNNGLPVRDKKI